MRTVPGLPRVDAHNGLADGRARCCGCGLTRTVPGRSPRGPSTRQAARPAAPAIGHQRSDRGVKSWAAISCTCPPRASPMGLCAEEGSRKGVGNGGEAESAPLRYQADNAIKQSVLREMIRYEILNCQGESKLDSGRSGFLAMPVTVTVPRWPGPPSESPPGRDRDGDEWRSRGPAVQAVRVAARMATRMIIVMESILVDELAAAARLKAVRGARSDGPSLSSPLARRRSRRECRPPPQLLCRVRYNSRGCCSLICSFIPAGLGS